MKKAILLIAYGASNPHARRALSEFERLCRACAGDLSIRWAYTSERLRERLARERQKSDSVAKALLRLHYEKYEAVAVQPLQVIAGREFNEVALAVRDVATRTGMALSLGRPLLEADLNAVACGLIRHVPPLRQAHERVLFIGHGARHPAESMYLKLAQALAGMDANCLLGTMGARLHLAELLPRIGPGPVWLVPLLASVGTHVLRDMAGPDPNSWKSRLEAAGHECRPVMAGLVESPELARIWLAHLDAALGRLG